MRETLLSWGVQLVRNYSADGLRIDAVVHVAHVSCVCVCVFVCLALSVARVRASRQLMMKSRARKHIQENLDDPPPNNNNKTKT